MFTSAVRKLTDDEEILRGLTIKILQIPALRGLDWDLTSAEMIEAVMDLIMKTFDTPDPFRAVKEEQNQRGMELYPL